MTDLVAGYMVLVDWQSERINMLEEENEILRWLWAEADWHLHPELH